MRVSHGTVTTFWRERKREKKLAVWHGEHGMLGGGGLREIMSSNPVFTGLIEAQVTVVIVGVTRLYAR